MCKFVDCHVKGGSKVTKARQSPYFVISECSWLFALLVFAMSPVFAEDSFGDSDSSVEGSLEESRELFAPSGAEDDRRDEVDLTPRFVNVPRSPSVVKGVTRRLFSESIPPPSHVYPRPYHFKPPSSCRP